jgi:teichuronic acid biosynthesis glycosyltransferase TuaC
MRILTFTSLFPNEVRPEFGVFVYQRVAALARRADNVVQVIAPVPYFPSWIPIERWRSFTKIPKSETVGSLPVAHPRYALLPGIMPLHGWLIFLGCLPAARRLHREHNFECIDAHYIYPDGFAAILLSRVLGIPVFLSARGTDINVFPRFRLIRPMIRWSLRRAAGVVAVSEALKKIMVELGAPADKIKVIANGIDAGRFHAMPQAAARQELGIPLNAKVIISVGALIPAKSHEMLIRAVARLGRGDAKPRLYIAGEGLLLESLTNLITELHLEEQVFLVGRQPNEKLKLWFSAADISCLASLREGMPNVVLESLACGTPVVATRVGGVPEVLVSDKLGVLVEPKAEAIAQGLEAALQTPWDREFIAQHTHARTWDVVAEEVERYFVDRCKNFNSEASGVK